MIEHCVSTHNAYIEELNYRIYSTDLFKAIAERLGVNVNTRFWDLVQKKKEPEETRSPEEIINAISSKLQKLGEGEK